MRKVLVGGLLVAVAACAPFGGRAPAATPKPSVSSPSPTATPTPAATPAAVLIDWNQNGSSYTLSLVSAAAKVLATTHASWTRGARCGPMEAGIVAPPPVSTSNSRVYYADAGAIKWLQEDGTTGVAYQGLSSDSTKAYGFAMAPDDSLFALNTIDYSGAPTVHQSLTVTKVGASALGAEIYSSSLTNTAAVWPAGWHAGDLVLAYHSSTCTQGGGPGIGDAVSYHVVNAKTADRKATLGSDNRAACGFVGSPTPAGVACGSYSGTTQQVQPTQVLDWTGASHASYGASFLPGGLSPDGNAYVGQTGAGAQLSLTLIRAAGNALNVPVAQCFDCPVQWIDTTHFLVAPSGNASAQVFVTSPEPLQGVSVTAQGIAGGRIPGGLDNP